MAAGRKSSMTIRIFRYLGLKLLALGLAILLWFVVVGEPFVERGLRAPLEFQNIPEGFALVGEVPSTVDVRLRGTSALLGGLNSSDVVAVVDLGSAQAGRRLFHLSPDEVRVPFGVEVAQVSPSTILLALDRSGRRFVPIEPVIEGNPAPGYVVGQVSSLPKSAEVVGPMSQLTELEEVITEPVLITGATETIEILVGVGVSDGALYLPEPSPAKVTVEIRPADPRRVSRRVTVVFKNLAASLRVSQDAPMVIVWAQGPRVALDGFRGELIDAWVDLAGLYAGNYTLPVQVELGPELVVDGIEPTAIEIEIR
jgi:YbbR domain-containing protein